jgi:hypothetical protein
MVGAVTEDRILKELEVHSSTLKYCLDEFSAWLFTESVRVVCCFEKNVTDYSSRMGRMGIIGNMVPWTKQLVC